MSGIYTRKNVGMNGLVENRTEDHINEEWFRNIIDANLYNRIDGFEYKRMLDRANQLKGIDVDAHLGNEHFIIDEKVQTSKLKVKNKRGKFTYFRDGKEYTVKTACTPTFCFELACCKMSKRQKENNEYYTRCFDIPTKVFGKNRYPGWFLDANKETEYYVCVWPHNYDVMEAMLISRQDLFDALQNRGMSSDTLIKDLEDISADAYEAVHKEEFEAAKWKPPLRYYEDCLKNKDGEYDAWFTSSVYNLAEAPINLICKKDFLLSLPHTKHWIMLPNEEELVEQ